MTLLSGDRVRLCLHPRTVEHPLPALVPTVVNNSADVELRPHSKYNTPLRLVRCLECGTVGEVGT